MHWTVEFVMHYAHFFSEYSVTLSGKEYIALYGLDNSLSKPSFSAEFAFALSKTRNSALGTEVLLALRDPVTELVYW